MSPRGGLSHTKPSISCHVVEPTNASPRIVVIGPNFQDIANTKGMTATALRVFLSRPSRNQRG
jgi:hypothetical protein